MIKKVIQRCNGKECAVVVKEETTNEGKLCSALSARIIERERTFNFDKFVAELIKYKKEFGDLVVHASYRSKDTNYPLGAIIMAVRCSKKKLDSNQKPHGYLLTEKQYKVLEEIGFAWKINRRVFNFDKFYAELLKYKEKFGDVHVPVAYIEEGSDYRLGGAVARIRLHKKEEENGEILPFLTEEQYQMLDDIGFLWDAMSFNFENFVEELQAYKNIYGNLNVPVKYINPETGYKLGGNISRIRQGRKKFNSGHIHYGEYSILSKEDYDILDEMGFVWDAKITFNFDKFYEELLIYKEKFGDVNVPARYRNEETNYRLGNFVSCIRVTKKKVDNNIKTYNYVLTAEEYKKLNDIGFVWQLRERRMERENNSGVSIG